MSWFVVATKIIISAMLKRGINQELLFSPKLSLFAPDFLESEFSKYQEEIFVRSGVAPPRFFTDKNRYFFFN